MPVAPVTNPSRSPTVACDSVVSPAPWPLRGVLASVLMLPLLGCTALKPSDNPHAFPEQAVLPSVELPDNVVHIGQPSDDPVTPLEKAALSLARLPDNLAKTLEPSNDRDWSADMAVLPYAEFQGDLVTVHNIRNCDYRTVDDYILEHYDKTFDLNTLESVDFVVVPFLASPGLAHVMLSFGFRDGDYLGLSVEIRREKGEKYAAAKGILRQFELMYVIGDERDLIKQCTDVHLNGVYVYHSRFTADEARALFVDVMRRTNQLAHRPEFYNSFTNNCTTNIVRHVNRLGTRKVPYSYHVLMPGHFDRLLYGLGLIDNELSFAQTHLRARVNELAYLYADNPDYSVKIRQ